MYLSCHHRAAVVVAVEAPQVVAVVPMSSVLSGRCQGVAVVATVEAMEVAMVAPMS
jgi:hypothetical protein